MSELPKSKGNKANGFSKEERLHYNSKVDSSLVDASPEEYIENYSNYTDDWKYSLFRAPYYKWHQLIITKAKKDDQVLDYCSGQGHHAITIQKSLKTCHITGFDISDKSIDFANNLAKSIFKDPDSPQFSVQDAHNTTYENKRFNLICNFGSLSSLELEKAIKEIDRLLVKDGVFISIETFGHNPLTNLKRILSKMTGRRTEWATQNIVKEETLNKIRETFPKLKVYYFCFSTLSLVVLPEFIQRRVLIFFEKLDQILFNIFPFLRKYSFKVVFEASR